MCVITAQNSNKQTTEIETITKSSAYISHTTLLEKRHLAGVRKLQDSISEVPVVHVNVAGDPGQVGTEVLGVNFRFKISVILLEPEHF